MNRRNQNLNAGELEAASRPRRLFTVAEANRALVLVRRIVSDILTEYARLSDLQEMMEAAQESGKYDRARSTRDKLIQTVDCIQDYVEELDDVGVDLKDWTLGVVDFPCVVDGREVALCWQAGEAEIEFFHDVDSQCRHRKPIDLLPAAEISAASRL